MVRSPRCARPGSAAEPARRPGAAPTPAWQEKKKRKRGKDARGGAGRAPAAPG